jgi:hypothetical protein
MEAEQCDQTATILGVYNNNNEAEELELEFSLD